MKKINLITIGLFLSFSANAANTENGKPMELYEKIRSDENVVQSNIEHNNEQILKDFNNSDDKSNYRNLKYLEDLKKDYFESKTNANQKALDARKSEYFLNLPIEQILKNEGLDIKIKEDPNLDLKPVKNTLPEISDASLNFDDFETETYSIDQLIIKEEKQIPKEVISDEIIISNKKIEEEKDNKEVKISENVNKDTITEEELAILGWTREEYNKFMNNVDEHEEITEIKTDDKNFVEQEYKPEVVEFVQFSEIRQLEVKQIIIFKDQKIADLSIEIYVGDGVNGNTHNKKLNSINEGAIFTFKGFKYKINSITKDKVEIEDLTSKKTYTTSSTNQ